MTLRSGIAATGLCVLLWGCFTEVGNAEDEHLVEAEFGVDYARNAQPLPKITTAAGPSAVAGYDSVSIESFCLRVRDAEYWSYDSAAHDSVEQEIWNDDSAGQVVDFTGRWAPVALPEQHVPGPAADRMDLECALAKPAKLAMDTVDFKSFWGEGYIKGLYCPGVRDQRFLFALPPGREIHFGYSRDALAGWYAEGEGRYRCRFQFFATKWMMGHGMDTAHTWRDRAGHAVALIDSSHNVGLYRSLGEAFTHSFNSRDVSIEQ